jgi:hypothetical protein
LHKLYLGQPRWGLVYLLLSWTPLPVVAAIAESIWYLAQDSAQFNAHFNQANPTSYLTRQSPASAIASLQLESVADAIRQLDQLREDGLVSEYEFERKRRQLLDRMGKPPTPTDGLNPVKFRARDLILTLKVSTSKLAGII